MEGLVERLAGLGQPGTEAVWIVTGLPSSKTFKVNFVLKCFDGGSGLLLFYEEEANLRRRGLTDHVL